MAAAGAGQVGLRSGLLSLDWLLVAAGK